VDEGGGGDGGGGGDVDRVSVAVARGDDAGDDDAGTMDIFSRLLGACGKMRGRRSGFFPTLGTGKKSAAMSAAPRGKKSS
jgi:hypothetical protein